MAAERQSSKNTPSGVSLLRCPRQHFLLFQRIIFACLFLCIFREQSLPWAADAASCGQRKSNLNCWVGVMVRLCVGWPKKSWFFDWQQQRIFSPNRPNQPWDQPYSPLNLHRKRFFRRFRRGCVKLTTQLPLVSRLRMSGSIPPLPNIPSQTHRNHFVFTGKKFHDFVESEIL